MKKPPFLMRLGARIMRPTQSTKHPIDWQETARELTLMEGGKISLSQAQVGEVFKLVIRWAWVEMRTRPVQLVYFLWQHR